MLSIPANWRPFSRLNTSYNFTVLSSSKCVCAMSQLVLFLWGDVETCCQKGSGLRHVTTGCSVGSIVGCRRQAGLATIVKWKSFQMRITFYLFYLKGGLQRNIFVLPQWERRVKLVLRCAWQQLIRRVCWQDSSNPQSAVGWEQEGRRRFEGRSSRTAVSCSTARVLRSTYKKVERRTVVTASEWNSSSHIGVCNSADKLLRRTATGFGSGTVFYCPLRFFESSWRIPCPKSNISKYPDTRSSNVLLQRIIYVLISLVSLILHSLYYTIRSPYQ